ncbi:MAG TPA: class I SAM-dependent methyltransferase [Ignavibacteria bacterium]|nr:class I SAM-dependent methyltransferase [Ignavibacteria bacterium]HMR41676.1 class I SAM-dependent methyltransferase [Ignavibacteria bacterium]
MKKADYNLIAKYYDTVIGAGFETGEYLYKILRKYFKKSDLNSVLELGCGTGENLKAFQKKYDITGIDISSEMIMIAKKKLPRADLSVEDIRKYEFDRKFDLILCLYDTINHITLFSDWKKIFKNTSEHLNANGLFVFDINTIFKLDYFTAISPIVHEFGKNYLIINIDKAGINLYNWNLKMFEKVRSNNYKLIETNIKESSFALIRIKTELEKYFNILKIEDDTGRSIKENSGRVFFICRKK